MKRRQNEDASTRISKDMSKVLRHKPPPGAMDAAGWVNLPVLLRHLKNQPTEQQVREIVAACPKKRFVLDDTTNPPRIRAAQGHSVELEEAVLEPVTEASQVPVPVHVTGVDGWSAIQSSGELRRMKRTHVHFATAPHHLRNNKWAEVYLRLDLQAALDAGLQFGLSSNGVLLCEGPVPVALVKRVELDELPEEWRQGRGQQGQGQQEQGAEKKQRQGKGKAQQGQPPEQKDEGKERREQEAAVGGDKDTEGVKEGV